MLSRLFPIAIQMNEVAAKQSTTALQKGKKKGYIKDTGSKLLTVQQFVPRLQTYRVVGGEWFEYHRPPGNS